MGQLNNRNGNSANNFETGTPKSNVIVVGRDMYLSIALSRNIKPDVYIVNEQIIKVNSVQENHHESLERTFTR